MEYDFEVMFELNLTAEDGSSSEESYPVVHINNVSDISEAATKFQTLMDGKGIKDYRVMGIWLLTENEEESDE